MEKESVKVFDLQAAFKALDEIETPKTKEGLRANRVDLKERFAAKDAYSALVEDYYNVNDHQALEEAQEDRESEIAKAKLARIEKIVDLDAETEDDLLPSYVGKVIIQCPQCMTLFYKKPEDIEKSEENPDVVNINEPCQHCGNTSGYTVIGKVDKVGEDEAENFDVEDFEENELDLDFGEPTEETSPEGTGEGFEEETIEDSEGSEELDLDLNLEEVELEPAEESLKVNEAIEDSGSEDKDETEVTVTLGEIKDVAEEAGKAIIKAEVEEKEEVKEVTDKVVEKEIEAEKEVLTEGLTEENKICEKCGKEICECDKTEEGLIGGAILGSSIAAAKNVLGGLGEEVEKKSEKTETKDESLLGTVVGGIAGAAITDKLMGEGCNECEHKDDELTDEEKARFANRVEVKPKEEKPLKEAQSADEIDQLLWDAANSFDESLEECNKSIKEDKVSDSEFKQMINSPAWKEFDESLNESADGMDIAAVRAKLGKYADALEHAGEQFITNKPVEEGIGSAITGLTKDIPILNTILASDEAEKKSIEEDAIMNKNDSQGRVDNRQITKPEEKEAPAIPTAPVEEGVKDMIPTMDFGGININLDASGQNNAVGFGGSQPKVEGYKGTPEERTTHLGYVDDNPTDGEAVLPKNIEKQLTEETVEEHVQDRPAPVEDETELHGMDNAIVDCETDFKVIAHSEDEKPLACKGYKEELKEAKKDDEDEVKFTDKYIIYGTNTAGDILVQKEFNNVSKKAKAVKDLRDSILNDNEDVIDVFVSRITVDGEEKPLDSYTITRPGHEFDGLDDFDELYFDNHINEYLKEVYSNVSEYKTTGCRVNDNKLFVEGVITFKSGKAKNTVFEFVPTKGQLNNIICEGYNKDLSNEKAFTIKGTLENNHVFVTESINYKYTINETLVEGLK